MAVAIFLSRSEPADAEPSAGMCFEDDGYYWFLYPFFERVSKQTGQMVDPYGDAVFKGDQLIVLLAALGEASAATEEQPEDWNVRLGWRGEDQVFDKVSKNQLQRLLADFIALASLASRTGKNVVCSGD